MSRVGSEADGRARRGQSFLCDCPARSSRRRRGGGAAEEGRVFWTRAVLWAGGRPRRRWERCWGSRRSCSRGCWGNGGAAAVQCGVFEGRIRVLRQRRCSRTIREGGDCWGLVPTKNARRFLKFCFDVSVSVRILFVGLEQWAEVVWGQQLFLRKSAQRSLRELLCKNSSPRVGAERTLCCLSRPRRREKGQRRVLVGLGESYVDVDIRCLVGGGLRRIEQLYQTAKIFGILIVFPHYLVPSPIIFRILLRALSPENLISHDRFSTAGTISAPHTRHHQLSSSFSTISGRIGSSFGTVKE